MSRELISHTLPNLINGISQQSPKVRLESQSSDELNTLHDVSKGLRKRLPTKRCLPVNITEDSFVHYIDKGSDGLFAIILDNNSISAVNLKNNEPVKVNAPNLNYLNIGNAKPRDVFAMVSVGDISWVLNKTRVIQENPIIEAAPPAWAAYRTKQTAADVKYSIDLSLTVDGVHKHWGASYTVPKYKSDGKTAFDLSSVTVIEQVRNALTRVIEGGVLNRLDIAQFGKDTLLVTPRAGHQGSFSNITIVASDSMADSYTVAFGSSTAVRDFVDLPNVFRGGYTVKVSAEEADSDDYYVSWDSDGIWRETYKKGEKTRLQNDTLPWRLELNFDSHGKPYFDFVVYVYDGRCSGDEDTNPFPSFVGRKCSDVFFHRNRLGLLSEENTVLSEAASYRNFFVTTMRTTLDSDVIDIASPTNEVNELAYAIPFNKELVLFSPKAQFTLTSGDTLTPSNVALLQAAKYEADIRIRPITLGSSLFFVSKLGDVSALWEMTMLDSNSNLIASNVVAHAPTLIKGDIISMTGSALFNKICLVARSGNTTTVYVYSFHTSNGEKLQSAWSKWDMPHAQIIDAKFINSELFFTLKRSDGKGYIEVMHVDEDPDTEKYGFVPHLDSLREISSNETIAEGERKYSDRVSNITFAGYPYTMLYELSPQVARSNDGIALAGARMQMRNFMLTLKDTGNFTVEVTPEGRETKTTEIASRVVGGLSSILSPRPAIMNGDRRFHVNSNAETVKVIIKSAEPLPFCVQSAAYEGFVVLRANPR